MCYNHPLTPEKERQSLSYQPQRAQVIFLEIHSKNKGEGMKAAKESMHKLVTF